MAPLCQALVYLIHVVELTKRDEAVLHLYMHACCWKIYIYKGRDMYRHILHVLGYHNIQYCMDLDNDLLY